MMKSKEFTIGISVQLKERTYEVLLEETKEYGWVRITLCQSTTKLQESFFIGKRLKNEKMLNKLTKRLEQLELNYREIKNKPNIVRVLKQVKRIVANL